MNPSEPLITTPATTAPVLYLTPTVYSCGPAVTLEVTVARLHTWLTRCVTLRPDETAELTPEPGSLFLIDDTVSLGSEDGPLPDPENAWDDQPGLFVSEQRPAPTRAIPRNAHLSDERLFLTREGLYLTFITHRHDETPYVTATLNTDTLRTLHDRLSPVPLEATAWSHADWREDARTRILRATTDLLRAASPATPVSAEHLLLELGARFSSAELATLSAETHP